MIISPPAQLILQHFGAQDIGHNFEYPSQLSALFESSAKCEAAQKELEDLGLLELGPEIRHADDRVRAAALTMDGARYIQKLDEFWP